MAAGVLWLLTSGLPELEPVALRALQLVAVVLLLAALGLWPLVVMGLIRHGIDRPVEWFISLR